jgi:hypothetical protein
MRNPGPQERNHWGTPIATDPLEPLRTLFDLMTQPVVRAGVEPTCQRNSAAQESCHDCYCGSKDGCSRRRNRIQR